MEEPKKEEKKEEKKTYDLKDLTGHLHKIKNWVVETRGEMKGFPQNQEKVYIGLIFYFFGTVPANIKTETIELGGWTVISDEADLISVKEG